MTRSFSTAAFTRARSVQPNSAGVIAHPVFSPLILNEPYFEWWQEIIRRLDELCKLEPGWDGYAAPPVSFSNAYFAASVLASACPPDAPKPEIVPGTDGDLQIEWHTCLADIELDIHAPYEVHAWRLGPTTAIEGEEHKLTSDFRTVARWLAEISGSEGAPRSAAA